MVYLAILMILCVILGFVFYASNCKGVGDLFIFLGFLGTIFLVGFISGEKNGRKEALENGKPSKFQIEYQKTDSGYVATDTIYIN